MLSHALEVTLASLASFSSSVPLFSPDPAQFLDFLARQLEQSNSYFIINNTRSAISLIAQNEIENHPLVKRFCKEVGNLKPPRPYYDFVWDPAPVITKLSTLCPYDSLSLNVASKKLALLLALGTGQHVQTLTSLRLS